MQRVESIVPMMRSATRSRPLLYEVGTEEFDGVRVGFAIHQRLSNDLLNQAIFAVFATMQTGDNMTALATDQVHRTIMSLARAAMSL